MKNKIIRADERGNKDSGWLKSKFILSFSNYVNPELSAFGTLFAFNDDLLSVGKGFGMHPHVNMEIISVLLKGKMNHKDSMDQNNIIGKGGVQIMSSGSGLFHEEYNVGDEEVNILQIWIYPKLQNVKPRYQYRSFPNENRFNKLQTIVSSEEGQEHCWINQNAKLSLGYFDAGNVVDYRFNPVNKCLFIYCIEGTIHVGENKLDARDGIGVWETDECQITIQSKAEFLIIETPVNQK